MLGQSLEIRIARDQRDVVIETGLGNQNVRDLGLVALAAEERAQSSRAFPITLAYGKIWQRGQYGHGEIGWRYKMPYYQARSAVYGWAPAPFDIPLPIRILRRFPR